MNAKTNTDSASSSSPISGPDATKKEKTVVQPGSDRSKGMPGPGPKKVEQSTPPKASTKRAQSAKKMVRIRSRHAGAIEVSTKLVGDDGETVNFGICANAEAKISEELWKTPQLQRLADSGLLQLLG